jgi:hypothetical protein
MSDESAGPDERVLQPTPLEAQPPAELERRVVAELRRRGLIRGAAPERRRWALAAALALAFALGLVAGARFLPGGAASADSRAAQSYLLLLYEPRPLDRAGVDLVAEYSAWAGGLAKRGQLVVAEKLSGEERRLPERESTAVRGDGPTGFFLIRAANLDEALAIARGCPHLAHGGELALRPIDPT